MQIIQLPKGGGKTSKLIELSAETGGSIVCAGAADIKDIKQRAEEMRLQIPEPLTYWEVLNNSKAASKAKSLLIDNIDKLLALAIRQSLRAPITHATITLLTEEINENC